jgi:hypothetical protein
MDNKIDELLKFKWQIIGGAGVVALVITISFNLVTKFF